MFSQCSDKVGKNHHKRFFCDKVIILYLNHWVLCVVSFIFICIVNVIENNILYYIYMYIYIHIPSFDYLANLKHTTGIDYPRYVWISSSKLDEWRACLQKLNTHRLWLLCVPNHVYIYICHVGAMNLVVNTALWYQPFISQS